MRQLAAAQDGVVGIRQLPVLGLSSDHWWRARRNGRWAPITNRVQRLDGSFETDRQRVLAAILDAGGGAVLHGPSALAWMGLRGFDLARIHLVRMRGDPSRPGSLANVHWLRDLSTADRTTIRGVPTVSPLRAIWSEASRYSNPALFDRGVTRIGRLLDDAHRKRLVRWHELHTILTRVGKRGRAGTTIMRHLAADRPPGSSPTESRLEDQFEAVMRKAGLEKFRRQVYVGENDVIGRTDFHHASLPLVVEVNSLEYHSTPSDQAADEDRYALLVGAGFTVAVVWDDDLWSDTYSVRSAVSDGERRASAGRPAVVHSASCPWPHHPNRIVIGKDGPPHRG